MDQAKPVGRIDVISDVICPWCYIGKRHLEQALALLDKQGLHFTVAWHPFQLNPDMPAEGVERKAYREAKFGGPEKARQIDERITETAATVGLEFHLDRHLRRQRQRVLDAALADVAPRAHHVGDDIDLQRF